MGLFARVVAGVGVSAATVVVGALAAGEPADAACPKLSQAAELPVWQRGGVAFGDVEGSGYRGRATIRYAKDASSICGFILVIETRKGFLAARVPEQDYGKGSSMPIRDWPYPYGPGVGTVVRLGGSGRSQFVVGRWQGASTSFMSLYGLLDGKLALIPFRGGPAAGTMLGVGGSAASSTTVRCVRGGPLTFLNVSGNYVKGKRSGMRFSRYTYRLRRDGFRLTRTETTTGTDATIDALAERSGMNRSGFKGCAVS